MGYTHYFEHKKVTVKVWNLILEDCRKLYENMPKEYDGEPLALAGETGPKLGTKNDILFNGVGGLSHEPFCLFRAGSKGFHFCKTARKPYDLMVCACLIVYVYHSRATMPELDSDGGWSAWQPAMTFVQDVLGAEYIMKFKMEQEFD